MSPGFMRSSARTTERAQSWQRFVSASSNPRTTGRTRRPLTDVCRRPNRRTGLRAWGEKVGVSRAVTARLGAGLWGGQGQWLIGPGLDLPVYSGEAEQRARDQL